jgi:hypothetical protein
MKKSKLLFFLILSFLSFSLFAASVQDAGETVDRRGPVNDDYYAAGGTVNINARIKGDVIAAGGTITISDTVSEDVMAAGGTVTLQGNLQDDVRVAGGTVTIDASVGDDLVAAGGELDVTAKTRVNGKAFLAGGEIKMNGTINDDLWIGGGEVVITGTVKGNVQIQAAEIEIRDGARIDGNLSYKSPHKAEISKGAVISGKITYTETEDYHRPSRKFAVVPAISITIAGIVLLMLFPNFTQAASARVSKDFWKNLGLGFALLVATPIAAILLMLLVIGFHVGMPLLLTYLVGLLIAFLVGAFYLANTGAHMFDWDVSTRGRLIAMFVATIVVLAIVRLIPVLGGLVIFLLMITALGATTLQLYDLYRGGKNVAPTPVKRTVKKTARKTGAKKTGKKKTVKKKKSR